MTLNEWLSYGLMQEWIVAGCMTHDQMLTDEEAEQLDEGDDPCIPVLRIVSPL